MPILKRVRVKEFWGNAGESLVDRKLKQAALNIEHRQINNLILNDEYSRSNQIDHVEIRENGIFCIETKNYKGLVFGNENDDYWTQINNDIEKQYSNPIKQNNSHIKYNSKVLGDKYKINSLIVMARGNANNIKCENVISILDLKDYLNNFNDGTKLSIEEMDEVYTKLLNARSQMTGRDHVHNIKKKQNKTGQ